jgi:hypothetical protein
MKSHAFCLAIVSAMVPAFLACSSGNGVDVYVAGQEIKDYDALGKSVLYATLWKNGSAQYFPMQHSNDIELVTDSPERKGSGFTSGYLYGDDVYLAGWSNAGYGTADVYGYQLLMFYSIATIWKNGVPIPLKQLAFSSCANSIFVDGGDVYTGGYENSRGWEAGSWSPYYGVPLSVPMVWKNGEPQHLEVDAENIRQGRVYSVFVSDNNVYAAGELEYWDEDGHGIYSTNYAALWVNGVLQILESDSDAGANSVAVSGGDVYVAGWKNEHGPYNYLGSVSSAMLWKNGVPQCLNEEGYLGHARYVGVFDNDVYVAGQEFDVEWGYDDLWQRPTLSNGPEYATIWKNGIPEHLGYVGRFPQAVATSIFLMDNDVYVSGSHRDVSTGPGLPHAMLWKNGHPQPLSDDSSKSVGEFVYVKKAR